MYFSNMKIIFIFSYWVYGYEHYKTLIGWVLIRLFVTLSKKNVDIKIIDNM